MRIALMLLGALLLAPAAAAQNALIDIPGNSSTPLFRLNDDGALISRGAFNTGAIPATGPGTRIMWHPRKAAFRAGAVVGTEWDEANVGAYSTALGLNTTASSFASTAMGNGAVASGTHATALGWNTRASGAYATALGRGSIASGHWSTALGYESVANDDYATAMGYQTLANGERSTAMGNQTIASNENATAMGNSTIASGFASTAMGTGTTASGINATAMGNSTTASGFHATAIGRETTASGAQSTAIGFETTAIGVRSTAMGHGTIALAHTSLVLGRYNSIAGNPAAWVSTDPVLVVGNGSGSSPSNRSNALTLRKNGNMTIAGSLTQNSDRRLKTAIQPLTDALDGLARLQPVRSRFRSGVNRPEGEHIGLIAQEVQAVFPELVSRGTDGYLSVSYTNLTAVLVQALNEQQDQIEAKHAEVETLKAHLATQQIDIEALKAELAALRDLLTDTAEPAASTAR